MIDLSAIHWSHPLRSRLSSDIGELHLSPPQFPQVVPEIWKDVVVLPGAWSVRALSIETGLSRWPSGAADDGTIYSEPAPPLEPDGPAAHVEITECRVVDGHCFVRIGGPNVARPSQLVCLDLNAQGRLLWSIGSDELAAQPEAGFSGPPLVSGGRVYVPVRSAATHVELGLACVDASTGGLLWNHRLCTVMEGVPMTSGRGDPDLLAFGAGLMFQMPAAGIIAACDAESGELRWAVTYPSYPVASDLGGRGGIVFHGGRLFAKPRDSEWIVALNAEDGRPLWSENTPGRIADLLGIVGGRLIASGDELWGFEAATGDAWRFGFDDPEGYGFGRAAVAGGRIYWPARDELFVVEATSGQAVDRILFNPLSGITGGNLATSTDRVIIAGPSQLTVLGPIPNR